MHESQEPQPGVADAVAVPDTPGVPVEPPESDDDAELEELLIREITIDGMCGVY
jgi:mycofactocin precursor